MQDLTEHGGTSDHLLIRRLFPIRTSGPQGNIKWSLHAVDPSRPSHQNILPRRLLAAFHFHGPTAADASFVGAVD